MTTAMDTTPEVLISLYNRIDSEARNYIWGGSELDEQFTAYRADFDAAAAEVHDVDGDPANNDPETGYSTRGEQLTEKIVERLCRKVLQQFVKDNGLADPTYMNPATGSVSALSDWICDYGELPQEEWGGRHFDDAGLCEVRKAADGSWEEVTD